MLYIKLLLFRMVHIQHHMMKSYDVYTRYFDVYVVI